jgi:succinate-semialdehyde dehydrogenase / glutarate-semialdehyde dehydrogenase
MMINVTNPRTGKIDYQITAVEKDQIKAIANRLRKTQPSWQDKSANARADILRLWAGAIQAAAPRLIETLSVDTGRLGVAKVEVFAVIGIIERWAAQAPNLMAALDLHNNASATPGVTISNRHVPYPLFGAIAPWNFPMLLALIDAIPALMAGCAALVKPSEVTPRFIPVLRETIEAVPELAKVFFLVEGDAETGEAIVEQVDYICFTGSVATGRKVAEAAARAFIPANLELGGKDPMIVLSSTDPQKAARIALRASIVATGQACQSIERLYVHRSIAEPFLTALVKEAETVELNYPDITKGHIGPFIFPPQAAKVQAQIDEAVRKGAKVLTGGQVETLGGGQYLRPTVLSDVTADMAVMTEETFGPVIPVMLYDDVAEAIRLANDSVYGLSAAVIGHPEEAETVGAQLEAGAISINDGAMTASVWDAENSSFKLSGMGPSRMGPSGLTRFFRTKALIRQNNEAATIAAFKEQ